MQELILRSSAGVNFASIPESGSYIGGRRGPAPLQLSVLDGEKRPFRIFRAAGKWQLLVMAGTKCAALVERPRVMVESDIYELKASERLDLSHGDKIEFQSTDGKSAASLFVVLPPVREEKTALNNLMEVVEKLEQEQAVVQDTVVNAQIANLPPHRFLSAPAVKQPGRIRTTIARFLRFLADLLENKS